jgi:hypothetical protein
MDLPHTHPRSSRFQPRNGPMHFLLRYVVAPCAV